MTIEFNSIPLNFRVPGQYLEFNNTQAQQGLVTVPQRILLIGQKLAAGSAAAGVPIAVQSADQVGALAGRGSMLHQMARQLFAVNMFTPVYILPLADAMGASASTRTVTLAGTATENGEIALYVGDTRYSIPVALGATAASLATAIETVIAADADAYVTADAVAAVVTLTARNAGIDAGEIGVTVSRYSGESIPLGITVTIAALTEGTVNPSIANALTALGDVWYPTIVQPFTDGANMAAFKAELADRFDGIRQIDGYGFSAKAATVNALVALATAENFQCVSLIDTADCLTPAYAVAAAVAGADAGDPDPGRPRQTLVLAGVLGKNETGRRTLTERNTLLDAGVSTLYIDAAGVVRIERLTTTYRLNAYGLRDDSYFDTESLHLLSNLRYTVRARFSQKYPRHKLGRDGSTGANVMTPGTARAEFVSLYRQWMELGWVEGGTALDQFKADIVVEIDATDPNRLNAILPPDLINQLRVLASSVQFRR